MEKKLTDETLQAVEDCGAAEMPVAEMCAIVEIGESEYWGDRQAQMRYRLGQLRTKFEIHKAAIAMAKSGVPQMVKVYQDFAEANAADVPPAVAADGESGGEFDGI